MAIDTTGWRAANGRSQTTAQRVLRQHQLAFRELLGIVTGLKGPELDRTHLRENYSLGKQRSIRNNLSHCVMAEWWAHAPQIRSTLCAARGVRSDTSAQHEFLAQWGEPPRNFGDVGELLEAYEVVHRTLMDEFSDITDEELEARGQWWESSPISVRFRLNRLGWHLHDHAAVIETILERLGRTRTETERLARRLYCALGEVEGALIGLSEAEQAPFLKDILPSVGARAAELERLADSF